MILDTRHDTTREVLSFQQDFGGTVGRHLLPSAGEDLKADVDALNL